MEPAGAGSPGLSQSPTFTSPAMTHAGVILGTAAYMAPEQARGALVDTRADVWAFGCVLYEMLTGRQAFEGATVSDVLAAILKSEPDFTRLPRGLHTRIRLLLERCLEKDLKDRYHHIADARVDLQKVLADPGRALPQAEAGPAPGSAARSRAWIPVATRRIHC
jgi:serine/threonine protein kinase